MESELYMEIVIDLVKDSKKKREINQKGDSFLPTERICIGKEMFWEKFLLCKSVIIQKNPGRTEQYQKMIYGKQ